MSKIVDYEIDVPEGTPNTKQAFINLIKENHHLFENTVMAKFSDDRRYTYFGENLEVTQLEFHDNKSGYFDIEVDVDYYDGCKDKNSVDQEELTVEFVIDDYTIKFSLDETIWSTE